jgi:uncharacterized protein (TIGR03435 family)
MQLCRTLFAIALVTIPAAAQPAAAPPAFDTVSVKLNRSADPHAKFRPQRNSFAVTNIPLRALIMYVYEVRREYLTGGPAWIDSDRWDIEATSADKLDYLPLHLGLRSLLADQFKLVLRPQPGEGPTFALVVAPNGPKLRTATSGESFRIASRDSGTGLIHMTATRVSMAKLAFSLGQIIARPVSDQTNLAGEFSFVLEYVPEPSPLSVLAPRLPKVPGQPTSGGEPSIFTALPQWLGLRLDPRVGPVPSFVIEHAEKPAQN